MAFAAVCYRCRNCSVMANSALFTLVHRLHSHLALSLFHRKYFRMALFAGECAGVKRMAERDRSHAVDLIHKLFVKPLGRIMAPGTFAGRECLLAVMAIPAISASVYVLHGDMSTAHFHKEELWMAFFAAEPLCVCLMVEP